MLSLLMVCQILYALMVQTYEWVLVEFSNYVGELNKKLK